MKTLLTYFFLILFPFFSPYFQGKVVGVSDGDTIKVLVDKTEIKVRLNGIDCPEKNQDFGQKAKQFASDLCFGKEVKVISFGKDRYGRTLGDVVLPDGRILNQELIKEGLAWHFKEYSKDTILAILEMKAREQKNGLWIQTNPTPPWDFRKEQKDIRSISSNSNSKEKSHYCYINELKDQNGELFLLVDYIEYLRGQAAVTAAKKKGEAEFRVNTSGDTTYFVYNDYYIKNENTKIRTFPLSPDVKIRCHILLPNNSGLKENQTVEDLKTGIKTGVFKIKLSNGKITSIEEIYVP